MSGPLGVILAGGLATRMGGGDKALLPLGDVTLLDQVIERLQQQVTGLALNANGDADRFARFGLSVLPDSVDGFLGPLAGVLAGLDWAAEQGAETIVTVAADTPFFPPNLVSRLMREAEGQEIPLVLAATPDGRHPTFGLWPVALRENLREALNDGLRKVVKWTDRHGGREAIFDGAGNPFFNVNTPEDLEKAREIFAAKGMNIYGVVGWKNAGKTGLMERLVSEITSRGFSVSTIKHAHHSFDVDHPGKDSFRHRAAGAREVLLASRNRWALMSELRGQEEPKLPDLLARLEPVDLVLVEGYKRDDHPKIEAFRSETGNALIAPEDETIRAVASDTALALDRPVFDLNDTAKIADFVLAEIGL